MSLHENLHIEITLVFCDRHGFRFAKSNKLELGLGPSTVLQNSGWARGTTRTGVSYFPQLSNKPDSVSLDKFPRKERRRFVFRW